ncbi:MAG: flagellar basal-body protein FlbY [Asticcacaulis sp.]
MALSASNASDRARQLIALSVRLGERLVSETQSLAAHRPQDIYDGIEETRNLSNLYRHETLRIKADPTLLDGLPAVDKQALREATELFQARLHKYELAVNAAKTVTEGIINAVAQDLSAQRNQSATYGARGRTRDSGPQTLNFGKNA